MYPDMAKATIYLTKITVVDLNGARCACGRIGCLETVATTAAMLGAAQGLLHQGAASLLRVAHSASAGSLTFRDLIQAELAGDALAVDVLSRGGRALGVGLANLVNTLDPERIVIGGECTASAVYVRSAFTEARARCFAPDAGQVEILVDEAGEEGVALGAAALALHDLFAPPFGVSRAVDQTDDAYPADCSPERGMD